MKLKLIIITISCLLIPLTTSVIIASNDSNTSLIESNIVYVKSLQTPVYKKASSNSEILTQLTRSTKVTIIQTNNMWVEIKYDDTNTGWVYKMTLSSNLESLNKKSIESLATLSNSQRTRASLYSNTAAARGFADTKEFLTSMTELNNIDLLKMESFSIDPQIALMFILEE